MSRIGDEVATRFRNELGKLGDDDLRIEACRAELADPKRKNTFRKIAAMESLVSMLGAKALPDLAPYLGHEYWRLRDPSRQLASNLVKSGGADALMDIIKNTTDPETKAGILSVIAVSGKKSGLAQARSHLKDDSPIVRVAAFEALILLGGESTLSEALSYFATLREREELAACEEALLLVSTESKSAVAVRDGLIKLLPTADPAAKAAAYHVLGRLGDAKSLSTLSKAAETNSATELKDIVLALSYSTSREADQILLKIAGNGKKQAEIVGAQSVRRMVLGPKGFGDLTDAERMDFAEPMLKLEMDGNLIKYLGNIRDARALRALMNCLERGYTDAAESLVRNAEKMENLTEEETKVALDAIRNVIEYIEVTHLRGGVKANMSYQYPIWKSLQARAGQVILKLHQPEKTPIKGFTPLQIDR
ncbi:MAG: HEAT repeat domain-containing protein [Akkermansiaceae bacterium]|nr:HEAT repeat domain-containing protein [Luteolibacter sp.]